MGEPFVCVAIKPVAAVVEVDWLSGRALLDERHLRRSAADGAACAVGAAIATGLGQRLVIVAVGGPAMAGVLAAAVAEGADRGIRVVLGADHDDAAPGAQWSSADVARALAVACAGASVVVCGDASADRGSGTVPALLAQLLDVPQALGLRDVTLAGGQLHALRRLDAGRRERLSIEPPCVLSVEAGAANPARAPLPDVVALASGRRQVGTLAVAPSAASRRGDPEGTVFGPFRPRASELAAPEERDPVRRAIEIAGTLVDRDPPEVLRGDPDEMAGAILERLERWGIR